MTALGQRSPARKVLFLSGLQVHPTLSGGNLRSSALASALRHHGLEVFVYSLVGRKKDYLARRPSSVQAWPQDIEEYVERGPLSFVAQYGSYALGLPPLWITPYLRAGAVSPRERLLPRRLVDRLRWCDVVVADFPFVHAIFSAPSARGKRRVLSTHNVEHHLFDGATGWRQRALRAAVRRTEIRAARSCDVLVGCSADDIRFFEAHAAGPQTVLVPNGIDPRRFSGIGAHRAAVRRELGIADDVKLVLFTGSKWGPNREAFEYLRAFATRHSSLLAEQRIHILAVGSVAAAPDRRPGFTATGRVEVAEPYFAAADAAINPMLSGAGTNVKMCEFIALRLPILTTSFGARGFEVEDGRTGFVFEAHELADVLVRLRRLFDEEPGRLRQMAAAAYARNEGRIDMDACVRPLVAALQPPDAGPRLGLAAPIGMAQPVPLEPVEEVGWLR